VCVNLGKRPLGRPRRRWKDNFNWLFKKWYGGVDWIDLALDRHVRLALVNEVMNLWVSQNAGDFLTG
jgi:hypothetical protein